MRSRSRPQRPRTGSLSAAKSAGPRATEKYQMPEGRACRRAAVVRPAPEAGREPLRGGRARMPSGRRGGAEPGPDGRWHPRGRAGENGAAGGAPSRQGATTRRDPGDCNAATILMESPRPGASEQSEAAPGNGTPWQEGSRRAKAVAAKRASADGLNWFFVAVVIIKRTRPETTRHLFAG
jgi:hypothetical protein